MCSVLTGVVFVKTVCFIAGILQARQNRRLCEAAGSCPHRWQPGLPRPRERSDDMSGHSGSLLCTAGSEGEEQRQQEGAHYPGHPAVHYG